MFKDRNDAARQLASRLLHLKERRPVVLALPRGGVPIGLEIAKLLGAPMDLVLVRKIGVPWQPELAAGAVVDGDRPQIVRNADVVKSCRLSEEFIREAADSALKEIERRREVYLAGRARIDLKDRTAIMVDDGIATGATMRAALKAVRRAEPKRLVLAVPVAPPDTIDALRAEADETVCLATPAYFGGISLFYDDFHQVSDHEVVDLMNRAAGLIEESRESAKP